MPVDAIGFEDGVSLIDQERCKGCGVCAAVCPEGAPQLILDKSVDVVGELTTRIRSRTEIGLKALALRTQAKICDINHDENITRMPGFQIQCFFK